MRAAKLDDDMAERNRMIQKEPAQAESFEQAPWLRHLKIIEKNTSRPIVIEIRAAVTWNTEQVHKI